MQEESPELQMAHGLIPGGAAIQGIAGDGMAGCCGMQPDLVHASCDGRGLQQRVVLESFQELEMGQGIALAA
jgi:hypothetical protein